MTVETVADADRDGDPDRLLAESEALEREYLKRLDEHTVSARDANRIVTVSTLASGEIVDVEISARGYATLAREDLAAAVVEAWQKARIEANAAATRIYDGFTVKYGGGE